MYTVLLLKGVQVGLCSFQYETFCGVFTGTDNSRLAAAADEADKLGMACGGAEAVTDAAIAMATAAIAGEGDVAMDVPIDENLFDDDELLDVENELETLELEQ